MSVARQKTSSTNNTRLYAGAMLIGTALLLNACLSDGGGDDGNAGVGPAAAACDGSCADASSFLTVTDVETVIAQAVAEAQARGAAATLAVTDRVGNVLGVFRMNGAAPGILVTSDGNISGGLEGLNIIPDTLAAIAKAVTASYLSTEGNSFTTRTASQIVQENFNPAEKDQPSGPLFGVQFSQLPCSDLVQRFNAGADAGPKRSPLGLSADPGGLPLYKNGTPVGAIGVIADGRYSLDKVITDFDSSVDELIALAGSFGYAAPQERRADQITVVGKTLRFSDAQFSDLASNPAAAPPFAGLPGAAGALAAVPGYSAASIIAGTAFGQPASGIRPDTLDFAPGLDAFVLVDNTDTERFRPSAGTDMPAGNAANALSAGEVNQILSSALGVANRARAQIRRPLGSAARVTVSVVDTNGAILGVVRGRDAPVFGTDVSLQKARTAAFFSGTGTAASPASALRNLPDANYINNVPASVRNIPFSGYVTALQNFLVPDALEAFGSPVAFSDRAGGNLSRPHFPDGPEAGPPGPLSKPPGEWSVFSTGLQLDLVFNAVIHHVAFVAGLTGADVGIGCTGDTGLAGGFGLSNPIPAIANGIQIFPGSVPIYRGNVLVGGLGVSGDGVDQDDLIAFLGLHQAALALANGIGNAPQAIRADTLKPLGVRLRYVNCPFAPFNGSNEQEVCNGL